MTVDLARHGDSSVNRFLADSCGCWQPHVSRQPWERRGCGSSRRCAPARVPLSERQEAGSVKKGGKLARENKVNEVWRRLPTPAAPLPLLRFIIPLFFFLMLFLHVLLLLFKLLFLILLLFAHLSPSHLKVFPLIILLFLHLSCSSSTTTLTNLLLLLFFCFLLPFFLLLFFSPASYWHLPAIPHPLPISPSTTPHLLHVLLCLLIFLFLFFQLFSIVLLRLLFLPLLLPPPALLLPLLLLLLQCSSCSW